MHCAVRDSAKARLRTAQFVFSCYLPCAPGLESPEIGTPTSPPKGSPTQRASAASTSVTPTFPDLWVAWLKVRFTHNHQGGVFKIKNKNKNPCSAHHLKSRRCVVFQLHTSTTNIDTNIDCSKRFSWHDKCDVWYCSCVVLRQNYSKVAHVQYLVHKTKRQESPTIAILEEENHPGWWQRGGGQTQGKKCPVPYNAPHPCTKWL